MGWTEERINRSSHPGGCKRARQRLCQPKHASPGSAVPGDEVLLCPGPASQRAAVSLPRCRGSLCSVPLTDVPGAHLHRPRPSCCLGMPGKAGRRGKPSGKLLETGRAPRVPPERAGRERRARLRAVPAALHQPPSLRHQAPRAARETGKERISHPGALPPSPPASPRRSAPSFEAGKSPKPG